jgi:hypothetical protein
MWRYSELEKYPHEIVCYFGMGRTSINSTDWEVIPRSIDGKLFFCFLAILPHVKNIIGGNPIAKNEVSHRIYLGPTWTLIPM